MALAVYALVVMNVILIAVFVNNVYGCIKSAHSLHMEGGCFLLGNFIFNIVVTFVVKVLIVVNVILIAVFMNNV